jgi:divalent metal cation (Fe/Co/Zn/Cd) transporter
MDAVKNSEAKFENLQEAYNRLLETSKQMENKYINIALENRLLKKVSDAETKIASDAAQVQTEISMAGELAKAKIEGKQRTQTEE